MGFADNLVKSIIVSGFILLGCQSAFSQDTLNGVPKQAAEAGYHFDNTSPAYALSSGPKIAVHRLVSHYIQRGAFEPFKTLVESDGFQFEWLDKPITAQYLSTLKVFIIANAYTKGGVLDYNNFSTLDAPSVYTDQEIALISNWVKDGGSLLILADHSPFAGGTIKLAEAFGFTYMTGVAVRNDSLATRIKAHIIFSDKEHGFGVGTLTQHPIVDGSLGRKPIDHYKAFEGQALIPPPDAVNLLIIPNGFETLLTFALREEFYSAPRMDASGLSQGAVMEFGKGRLAIFGETGGFTSQSQLGAKPFGLSDPEADQNADFVLSTLRWLARFKAK